MSTYAPFPHGSSFPRSSPTACDQNRLDAFPVAAVTDPAGAGTTITWHAEHSGATEGAAVVVAISGDLDRDSVTQVETTLFAAIDGNRQVYCDLAGVAFFGAAGVGAVVRAHEHAQASAVTFSIRGAHGLTRKILQFSGLNGLLQPAG
jgi:anti-anti-sigma factor